MDSSFKYTCMYMFSGPIFDMNSMVCLLGDQINMVISQIYMYIYTFSKLIF